MRAKAGAPSTTAMRDGEPDRPDPALEAALVREAIAALHEVDRLARAEPAPRQGRAPAPRFRA